MTNVLQLSYWKLRSAKVAIKDVARAVETLETKDWPAGHKKLNQLNKSLKKITEIIADAATHFEYREVYNMLLRLLISRVLITGLFLTLIRNTLKLPFETRKYVCDLFVDALCYSRRKSVNIAEIFFVADTRIISALLAGFENQETVMQSGFMLKVAIRLPKVTAEILENGRISKIFDLTENKTLDICSESFILFKCIMILHVPLIAQFLENNHQKFNAYFQRLLLSKNYPVRVEASKLLITLLEHRRNFKMLSPYILHQDIFRIFSRNFFSGSRQLQFLAFCLYKAILSNPTIGMSACKAFIENKLALLNGLSHVRWHEKYTTEDRFISDKAFVIRQLIIIMED